MPERRYDNFLAGTGTPKPTRCCAECGFESSNFKLFKKAAADAHTCSTGHYEDKSGAVKRAKNPYARR